MECLYREGHSALRNDDYEQAWKMFDEVERQYPYSEWAAKAQLMSAYASFCGQKFEKALATLDLFITLHPANPSIAYAYYLRAMCYYTDILYVRYDKTNAELALQAFEDVLRRFPDTLYAEDARFKRDFIREHLASQSMLIARYYLGRKNYIAALKRFSHILEAHRGSILIPEVLYRITECHLLLGFPEGAKRAASILGHNFPASPWYKKAFNLMKSIYPSLEKKRLENTQKSSRKCTEPRPSKAKTKPKV